MTKKLLSPPALKPGDTIGVMAPSSYIEKKDIEAGVRVLEKRGYKVFVHPQTYEREHQSAGNHLQKSLAFQGLWQRDDIKAIWAAGGGNRSMHLLDSINFEKLPAKPKILIGFSDTTPLLNAVYAHCAIPTVHGPVFKNLKAYKQLDELLELLAGNDYFMPTGPDVGVIQGGSAFGPLIGGNLSLFQYLPSILPNTLCKGAILFLEDCNEDLSKIDRMLLHLKQTGVFDAVKGIIFGSFSPLTESGRPFGYSLDDILVEHTQHLEKPVFFNAPFGHGAPFFPMTVGGECELDATDQKISIKICSPFS